MLSNDIKGYKIEEDMHCPQQPSSLVDCGPFVLHYIDSLANGKQPIRQEALNMRKKMLNRFANDDERTWRVEFHDTEDKEED